nr:lipoprotein [Parabacteroides goldsteinii]
MKQIIYTISLIFLLSGCTDEQYTDTLSSGGGEAVPVKLTLNTQPMQSPLSLDTKGSSDVVSSTQVCKGMEISLVETPVTRATLENEIKNFWVLQFRGTTPESTLCRKQFINNNSVKDVELLNLGNVKSRVIVIANASENTFTGLIIDNTTLAQFNDLGIPDTSTDYPLFHDPSTNESRIIFAGSTDMIVTTNKQADIMLYRSIARVKVNLSLSSKMQEKGYTTWNCQLMHIPKKSFYFSTDRIAVFPDVSVGYKDYAPQSGNQPPAIDTYLPVNLQDDVPYTTPEKRRTNAPENATYLQVMGFQMSGNIISRSVVYQIHLGSNFTNNYSVSPNVSYNYNITITGESEDDSRVVKFIPGYFGGALKMYNSDGEPVVNPTKADSLRYEKRIEVYISDVNPAGGIAWKQSGTMPSQLNDLMNGRQNTWDLKQAGSETKYPAIQKCIELNGTPPATMDAMVWYVPSYGQSLSIYVAGSNTLKTLPNTTYWSSTANGTFAWGTKVWSGQSAQESPETPYNLRCVKDLGPNDALQ